MATRSSATPSPEDPPRARLASPTVRRWELAARLRDLRTRSGMTIEDVATRLLVSPAKISRIETNERAPQPRDIRDLALVYGLSPAQTEELMDLVRGAKERAWWQAYDVIPDAYKTFVGLETAATKLSDVDGSRIMGLLQTADYTRALMSQPGPRPELPNARAVDEIVELRERRQARLTQEPVVSLHVVTTEAALRFRVGSAGVMARQIGRLLAATELPNVILQVIPFDAGATPALHGTFTILEFEPRLMSDVIFVEGLIGQYFFDKSPDVQRYRATFEVTSELALSAAETRKKLSAIQASWEAA